MGGRLMRFTSPCTRIIGGRPDDRCRSDALFLTTKASSSVRSITIPPTAVFFAGSSHYGNNRRQPASNKSTPCRGRGRIFAGDIVGGFKGTRRRAHCRSGERGTACVRRELRAGSAGKNAAIT